MSHNKFEFRHIGPNKNEQAIMLSKIGAASLDALIDETIPAAIRLKKPLNLPPAQNEYEYLTQLKKSAQKNKVYKSYLGLGYNNCIVPPPIQRNILKIRVGILLTHLIKLRLHREDWKPCSIFKP
jgi:glycine dehydrogenase